MPKTASEFLFVGGFLCNSTIVLHLIITLDIFLVW